MSDTNRTTLDYPGGFVGEIDYDFDTCAISARIREGKDGPVVEENASCANWTEARDWCIDTAMRLDRERRGETPEGKR